MRYAAAAALICLLLAVPLAADQRHQDKETSYSYGDLPDTWERIVVKGKDAKSIDAAFYRDEGGATILVNSTCGMYEPVPLVALTNHLLIDMTHREIDERQEVLIDGRMGLKTVVTGRLDGAAVKMDIRVVKIDACAYDLVYIAPPETFGEGHDDFKQLVAGFHADRIDGD